MTTDHAGVVYDLDGTLVRLAVDWERVEAEVRDVLREAGASAAERSAWGLLDAAQDAGVGDRVDALIAGHERDGASRSERLPAADGLADHALPVAVCSLNCETACRAALEVHGLDRYVDAVVGRDSVATRKPDPEPLLAAADAIGCKSDEVRFVGDSERDAETARRAGTAFEYVGDGPSGH